MNDPLAPTSTTLFPQPAPFAYASTQRLVPAGRFALISDPQDLDFAHRAQHACEPSNAMPRENTASSPSIQLSGFSSLAAAMLFLDGPARSDDWLTAIAMANAAFDAMGEGSPLPASIPIEIHRPSHAWGLREFFDLGSLHKLAYTISKKAGDPEGRIEQSFPETQRIASKLHAVGVMAGPSFVSSRHGPGTERVILGVANGGAVESAANLLGRHLALAIGLRAPATVLGKAMILLHETFHLQQDWQACGLFKSRRPLAGSLLPEPLASANPEFETEFAKHHAQGQSDAAWIAELLHESYADALSTMAIAGFEPEASAKACLATAAWRARVENPEDFSSKPLALARRAKQGSTLASDDFDAHRTGHALLELREALSRLPAGSQIFGPQATEAAKVASALGAMITIEKIVERPSDHSSEVQSTAISCARLLLGAAFPARPVKKWGTLDDAAWRAQALGKLTETIEELRSALASNLHINIEQKNAPLPFQTLHSPRMP